MIGCSAIVRSRHSRLIPTIGSSSTTVQTMLRDPDFSKPWFLKCPGLFELMVCSFCYEWWDRTFDFWNLRWTSDETNFCFTLPWWFDKSLPQYCNKNCCVPKLTRINLGYCSMHRFQSCAITEYSRFSRKWRFEREEINGVSTPFVIWDKARNFKIFEVKNCAQ